MTEPNLYLVGPRSGIGARIGNMLHNPNKPNLTFYLYAPERFVLGPIIEIPPNGSDGFMLDRRESIVWREVFFLTSSRGLHGYEKN